MKSSKDYLEEANAVVPRLTAEEAIARHGADGVVIVDVRDSGAVAQSGTVAGAEWQLFRAKDLYREVMATLRDNPQGTLAGA